MSKTQIDEAQINKMMEENVDMSKLPIYPHPIFTNLPEFIIPPVYDGDKENMVKRMQHKLHMLWLSWSDIRKNEKLSKMVNPSKKDSDDVIALKEAFILLLDRTGRVLCDTDLLEELKSFKTIPELQVKKN